MKTLLLIVLCVLVSRAVYAVPINAVCILPQQSAGVLTEWNAAAFTITDTVLSSEQVAEWFAVEIAPTTDDYYTVRNRGQVIYRVVAPTNIGTEITLWVFVSWATGKTYAVLTDGVIGQDGYTHPCSWGIIQYDSLPF